MSHFTTNTFTFKNAACIYTVLAVGLHLMMLAVWFCSLYTAYSQCGPLEKRPLLLENIKYGRRNRFVTFLMFLLYKCSVKCNPQLSSTVRCSALSPVVVYNTVSALLVI